MMTDTDARVDARHEGEGITFVHHGTSTRRNEKGDNCIYTMNDKGEFVTYDDVTYNNSVCGSRNDCITLTGNTMESAICTQRHG